MSYTRRMGYWQYTPSNLAGADAALEAIVCFVHHHDTRSPQTNFQ
jgi:hypothetical protein